MSLVEIGLNCYKFRKQFPIFKLMSNFLNNNVPLGTMQTNLLTNRALYVHRLSHNSNSSKANHSLNLFIVLINIEVTT